MQPSNLAIITGGEMECIDWTLLAIAKAGSTPLQPVQLQKALFLIGQNLSKAKLKARFYIFDAYDYGPFCQAVYGDAETLEQTGLVTITRPPQSRYKLYTATEAGHERARALEQQLDADAVDYVGKAVRYTQSLSFNDLVAAIYKAYPEMKVNSVFKA